VIGHFWAMLGKLTPRERGIVLLRDFHGWKYRVIAADYGVTTERIRQIRAKALRKICNVAWLQYCHAHPRPEQRATRPQVTYLWR
jgi:FixJ family two-component response regulator